MRRRTFLRGAATLPALGALPFAGGRARSTRNHRSVDRRAAGFDPLARTTVPGAKEAAVSADGRTAYLAVTDGFAAVDLSDPAAPELVHENRAPWAGEGNGRLRTVFDVKLDRANDLLAVVGPAQPTRTFQGLIVYDVSDPAAPEKLSVHATDFFNHNCDTAGGYVYLAGGRRERYALVMVDARSGEEVGRWSIADHEPAWEEAAAATWVLHDVHVRDGLAYLAHWDAGTWVVDVSDPAAPEFVATVGGRPPERFHGLSGSEARDEALQPPGNDHVTATNEDGTLLAVGVESWDADPDDDRGGPGGVTLYDVSDPAEPVERATIDPPPTPDPTFGGVWTTAHNCDLRGDRLYTSWYAGGVRLHDVSDPAEPVELAAWRDDATSFWTAQALGDDAVLAVSRKGRTEDGLVDKAGAELFTFPAPTEPVSTPTLAPTATPTRTPSRSPSVTRTPSRSPSATPADDGTATGTPTGNGTGGPGTGTEGATPAGDTGTEPVGTTAEGPGFGPLAALAGLGAGVRYAIRERDG